MGRVRAAWVGRILVGTAALAAAVAQAGELEPSPEGTDALAIAHRADRNLRGERTFLEARLTLGRSASDPSKQILLRLWDDRATARCFVRVVSGGSPEGTAFLKLPPNLWTYEARDDRSRRLRPSELKAPLLDSDFRIDDLLRVASLPDDYDVRHLGIDPAPDGVVGRRAHVLEYVRRSAFAGHWSRIVARVDTEWGSPLRRDYYDDEGTLVRVVRFGGIREVQGRFLPHVWIAQTSASGHESRIDIERAGFDGDIPGSTFTTRNLKPLEQR